MYILASDFDGTLMQNGVISESDRAAIKSFRAAGNLFGIDTGRSYGQLKPILDREGIGVDFLIVMNGGMAVGADGRIIFELSGNGAHTRDVIEYIGREFDKPVAYEYRGEIKDFYSKIPNGDEKFSPLAEADGIDRFWKLAAILSTCDEAEGAAEYINRSYGEHMTALCNCVCVDIAPAGVNKGNGIARYAEVVGVPRENVWCAGDNRNDIDMMKGFHGCAMTCSLPELKAEAEGVYDGICDVIDAIFTYADKKQN